MNSGWEMERNMENMNGKIDTIVQRSQASETRQEHMCMNLQQLLALANNCEGNQQKVRQRDR